MTRSIDIEQFVDLNQIDVRYFERPYVLSPDRNGEKGYVLLREAIAAAGKAGIARVVIRARQYLAALTVVEDALVLELLRYEQELRKLDEFDLPSRDLRKHKVTKDEIALAAKLIDGMSRDWDPAQFHDEYHDVLMELIERKIKSGETEAVEDFAPEVDEEEEAPPSINFMDVLRRSVEHAATSRRKRPKRRAARKKAAPRKRVKKKRAS